MKLSLKMTWFIRGVFTAVFVCAILLKVGPGRILHAFGSMDAGPVAFAVILGIPRLGIKIARWKILAGSALPGISWKRTAESLFVGTAGAIVTPGRVGQVTSSLLFRRDRRLVVSGLALLDPLSDLTIVGLVAVFVVSGCLWGMAATAVAVSAIFIVKHLGTILSKQTGKVAYAGKALLLLSPSTLMGIGFLSIVIYCLNLFQFFLLLNAIHEVSFPVAAESLPLIFLAAAVPFTIAGFGIREAVAALVLSNHGIPPEIGVQASFELFVINLLIPALIGAVISGRIHIGRNPETSGVSPES